MSPHQDPGDAPRAPPETDTQGRDMPTTKMIRTQARISAKYGLRRSLWCGIGYTNLTRTD